MSMEGFPQDLPNESERIDDVEKAEVMAYAGDEDRTAARKYREMSEGDKLLTDEFLKSHPEASDADLYRLNLTESDLRQNAAESAKNADAWADEAEHKAAEQYEAKNN